MLSISWLCPGNVLKLPSNSSGTGSSIRILLPPLLSIFTAIEKKRYLDFT